MVEPVSQRSLRRAAAEQPAHPQASTRARWKYALSAGMTIAIAVAVWLNRAWLVEAIALVRTADPLLLMAALSTILLSYLVSSQVFHVGLCSMDRRVGWLRLWATTITAIMISQSIPAGGVGSYAYFVSVFKRRGVAPSQSVLLAALEALSYAGAMLLIGAFSIVFLAAQALDGAQTRFSMVGPVIAAAVAAALLGGGAFAATRSDATLTRWVLGCLNLVRRVFRRARNPRRDHALAAELVNGRRLITAQRRTALLVVLIQMVALGGHSLALLLVLWSLGVSVSFAVVLAAFGVALITSTFNVLPGGGGTVETVLVAVLLQFGVGAVAVPAAIVFRLLNFWALLPVAAAGYVLTQHRARLHEN